MRQTHIIQQTRKYWNFSPNHPFHKSQDTPFMQAPQENTIFHHSLPIQIRFSDVDRFGHVNNNAYFAYYDLGKQEYMRTVLGPDVFDSETVPVVANINVDFFLPVHYGDAVSVETAVTRLGQKSFTLEQQAVRTDTGEVLCRCRTTMVCVHRSDGQSVPIPEESRRLIEAFEENLK